MLHCFLNCFEDRDIWPVIFVTRSNKNILLRPYKRAYSLILDMCPGENFLTFGATFSLWLDFFFILAKTFLLFSANATLFRWCDFLLLARRFSAGATFFRLRDFFLLLNFLALSIAARFIAGSSYEYVY